MLPYLIAVLTLAACAPESEEAPPDLSEYATLDDLDAATEAAACDETCTPDLRVAMEGCSATEPGEAIFTVPAHILSVRAGGLDQDYGWTWTSVSHTVYEPFEEAGESYALMVRVWCSELDASGRGISAGYQIVWAPAD